MHTKDDLRAAIKDRILVMTEKERAAESRSVCRRIREMLYHVIPSSPERAPKGESRGVSRDDHSIEKDHSICVYYPLLTEVDIRPLLEDFLTEGIPVFLPRFESGKHVFRRIKNFKETIVGSFGVPEPSATAEILGSDCSVILLVPGRAFDRQGGRLGRGNGSYDAMIRTMRKGERAECWGVAFECQIVQEVPMEGHDERVDAIVTGRGLMEV